MSRIIVKVFNQGGTMRITIPKTIYKLVGEPKAFEIVVEGNRIVLVPRNDKE